jgi:hypothetical protein
MAQPAGSYAPIFQRTVYTFQPGGTAGGAIYTDWPTLYADLLASGPGNLRTVAIDDSIGTATIPSGSWNMLGVTLSGQVQGNTANTEDGATHLHLANGCNFTISGVNTLWSIANNLTVFSGSSSPIIVATDNDGSGQHNLELNFSCNLVSTNGAAFISVPAGKALLIDCFTGGGLASSDTYASSNYEVIDIGDNAVCTMFGLNAIAIQSNTVRGTSLATMVAARFDLTSAISPLQTNMAGTFASANFCSANYVDYNATGTFLASSDVNSAITEIANQNTFLNATVQTSSNAATTILSYGTPNQNQAYYLEVTAIGMKSDFSAAASFKVGALFKNVGGTVTQIGTTQTIATVNTAVYGGVSFSISGNVINIQVSGALTTTVNWQAIMTAVQT